MKFLFFILTLLTINDTSAQQHTSLEAAPLNEIPFKFLRSHFNLKGPVKTMEVDGTKYEFDKKGYLVSIVDKDTKKFIYDDKNHLVMVKVNENLVNDITIKTDEEGRVKQTTEEGKWKLFKYDTNGNCISKNDNGKEQINYEYDEKGRMTKLNSHTISKDYSHAYSYNVTDGVVSVKRDTKATDESYIYYFLHGYSQGDNKEYILIFDKYNNLLSKTKNDKSYKDPYPRKYTYY